MVKLCVGDVRLGKEAEGEGKRRDEERGLRKEVGWTRKRERGGWREGGG